MSVAPPPPAVNFQVALPAGGVLHLQTPDEVTFWEESKLRYEEEYSLSKQNDLIALGQLLQQQVILFRAQTAINGMEPELDGNDVPTGRYKRVQLDASETAAWHKTMTAASQEMRQLEKALGIDKATREQGGAHTVDSYVRDLKRAAHARGIHIVERTTEYEKFCNEARVRLRILTQGDEEDRRYHNITAKSVVLWMVEELARIEEADKKWNREKGKLWIGQL